MSDFVYQGAIHIHTNHSDGTGDIETISKAAKNAGLDWIIITDHNYYDREEGIFNDVYVIKGEEISPTNNHYLVLGIDEIIESNENPQINVDKVREAGGFGFSAHPDEGVVINEKGELCPRKNSYHCIPWLDKNIKPDGVEIWNWFSNWADNLDDSSIFHLAYSFLFKHNIVKNPSRITLDWWDKLNNETKKIVPAIGGVDAHALKINKYIIPLTIFPYKTCFKTIRNAIYLSEKLSNNFEVAKKQILNAIKQGNSIIYNYNIYNKIPKIYVLADEKKYYAGENIKLNENCNLHFELSKEVKVCLIYNGIVKEIFTSDKFIYPIKNSGKYRLEVYYKEKGFLYTNPFNVVKDEV